MARDFQPFSAHTRPHSEFPSGTAALCEAVADFTDLYTEKFFNTTMTDLGNPTGMSFEISDMAELASLCGDSRLWGGMQFPKSVQAGRDIVTGIGQLALDYVHTIQAGSNWTHPHFMG